MSNITVSANRSIGLKINDGDNVTVNAGVKIIDPSVTHTNRQGLDIYAGIQNTVGGHSHVTVNGTAEGFIGAWFALGSDTVEIGKGGLSYGYNAGVEFHDGGHNLLTVDAGGTVKSVAYPIWFGDVPLNNYTDLPNSGSNAVHNNGSILAQRWEAIRMVLGGNDINNTGIIESTKSEAIHIDSRITDPANKIENSGHIVGGTTGVAIVGGNAPLAITNTGIITGAIDFGAGNDHYSGTGKVSGTIFGGAGNDVLVGGPAAETFDGGAGADTIKGGGGVDTFVYTSASDSTRGGAIDTLVSFDFKQDHLVINGSQITHFDHIDKVAQLHAHEAAVVDFQDHWYLVVDANGVAGYQNGADYMIALSSPVHLPT